MKKEFITNDGVFAVDSEENPKLTAQLSQGKNPLASEILALEGLIDGKSIVLDVGAHIGLLTIPLAHRAATLYAIEPAPINLKFLNENIAKNDIKNAIVFNVAAGKESGTLSMVQRGVGNTGSITLSSEEENSLGKVEIKKLDELVQKVDLIKIDIEGSEIDALTGACRLIRECMPDIFFEVNMVELRRHALHPLGALHHILQGYNLYLPIKNGTQWCSVPSIWLTLLILSPKTFFFRDPGFTYNFNLLATKKKLPSSPLWSIFTDRRLR